MLVGHDGILAGNPEGVVTQAYLVGSGGEETVQRPARNLRPIVIDPTTSPLYPGPILLPSQRRTEKVVHTCFDTRLTLALTKLAIQLFITNLASAHILKFFLLHI